MTACECSEIHERRRVVLTGGPGAGKTALLELIRQSFCSHVKVLPEAAGVVFGGGFPREDDPSCRRAAQRAIFYVQRELEAAGDSHNPAIVLCDRGTVDGLAYWPGPPEEFWASVDTTLDEELGRYHAVIHLRTPAVEHGYNHQNPLRTESPARAAEIDARIAQAWVSHSRRFIVQSSSDFLDKAARALEILRGELPGCCQRHVIPALRNHLTKPVGPDVGQPRTE
ncbi:MAG: ATP-binding protein [Vicinamibacterales bacterium]